MHSLKSLMALPAAEYVFADDVPGIYQSPMISADMLAAVVTNPTSHFPVAYTANLADCIGVIAVNHATQAVGVAHLNGFEGPALRKFVGAMRSDPGQTIDLYFTGGHAEAKDAGREKWTRRMAPLVTALNATPNIEVKSFDLDHKPHPTAIAVRIHEGKPQLIRFSGLSSQKHPDGEREFERGDIGRAWCKQGIRTKLCQVNYLALHADNEMSEYKNSARKPFTLSYDGRRSENQDPAKAALAAPPDDTGTPGQGDNWQTSIGPRTGRKKG